MLAAQGPEFHEPGVVAAFLVATHGLEVKGEGAWSAGCNWPHLTVRMAVLALCPPQLAGRSLWDVVTEMGPGTDGAALKGASDSLMAR